MFEHQIDKISANPNSQDLPSHPIIYRNLLDAASYKGRSIPGRASLLEEAITLVIAGTDTTGATMTTGTYEICRNPTIYQELKRELLQAWPIIKDVPRLEVLEKLPFLVRRVTSIRFSRKSKRCCALPYFCLDSHEIFQPRSHGLTRPLDCLHQGSPPHGSNHHIGTLKGRPYRRCNHWWGDNPGQCMSDLDYIVDHLAHCSGK